ncbi:MAG: geranylgeranylglyceryl/heptaprenylglyceryl phosphate synthase [Chlorobi bacterium]|nr:geranylgeranylglyceryl/heptaprenylglyceryl phosphate synthase [Chlorobiota bacterium]
MIYENILSKTKKGKKQIALLIDPDKTDIQGVERLLETVNETPPDMVLVGGSLISDNTGDVAGLLRENVSVPVLLFPGSSMQVTPDADGILFLSLLSGRNPEFLVSHHVSSALVIKASGMEVISTGYILVDGGKVSSVEYMSNTRPVPSDKTDISVATAVAGEMMGMKMIYLEAGSGALMPVPEEMISGVKRNLSVPLVVGGGLNTEEKLLSALNAGADIVVVGNAFENKPELLKEYVAIVRNF